MHVAVARVCLHISMYCEQIDRLISWYIRARPLDQQPATNDNDRNRNELRDHRSPFLRLKAEETVPDNGGGGFDAQVDSTSNDVLWCECSVSDTTVLQYSQHYWRKHQHTNITISLLLLGCIIVDDFNTLLQLQGSTKAKQFWIAEIQSFSGRSSTGTSTTVETS